MMVMTNIKICKSFAKVNLALAIVGRRKDGYHELKSLFSKIDLFDTVTLALNDSGKITCDCGDADIPTDNRNIAVLAAEKIGGEAGVVPGVHIKIEKRIPVSAGLGGGSSNAATVLLALNDLLELGLSISKLTEIALSIGADVPFFLGPPCSWVEGIGEVLTPVLSESPLYMVLLNPGFGVSAASAYKGSDFSFEPFMGKDELISALVSGDPEKTAGIMRNDLEPWVLNRHPDLATLARKIEKGKPAPLKVMMSGSGPTLMALYRNREEALAAEIELKRAATFVKMVKRVTS